MIQKPLLLLFLLAAMANANTLTLISGNGQVVPANTGQHGAPVVFQLTSGTTPVPGALVTFSDLAGQFGFPLTALSATTDSNGMVSVGFAPGTIAGVSELFTLTATSAGANVITFYESAALFPPTATSLTAPATPAFYPYTASAQTAGAPITIGIFGETPLPFVSLSIVPIPVAGVSPPPGTLFQSVSCLVNGALVSYVLTDSHGNATCAPVFSEPNTALNFAYNTGQFRVVIGGSYFYGPFSYNILTPPPAINAGPKNQVIVVGTPVVASVTGTGGTAPLTFTLAAGSPALPAGVTLNTNGQFAGTPTTPGIYPFTVQVTDALGHTSTSASLGLAFDVSGGPFVFTPAALEEAVVGVPYSQTVTVSGGIPPYKLSTGGSLPPGLTISFGASASTFTITGKPTASGAFAFSVLGVDTTNTAFQAPFPILVTLPLTVPGATLPTALLNTLYSFQLTPTNGVGPYIFTSSNLPAGLSVAPGGLLSGTPTTPGLDAFAITVTDFYSESVMTQLILPVSEGTLTVTSPVTLPAAMADTPYSQQIPAPTGGVPPYTYSLTGVVPDGITATTAGLLTGTFPTVGSQSISFQVTDAIGTKASGTLQVSVFAQAPVIGAITNGGSSLVSGVSPGEIVSLYGTGLGPTIGVAGTVANGVFTTIASGVQVTFGTYSAPVLFVSAGQVNAIVPFEVMPGTTVPVTVTYNGVVSASLNATVQDSAPGIFLIGTTQGAILNSDYSVNSGTNGAAIGSFVVIYATGSNALVPQLNDGELATNASTTSAADISVTIGGVAAQVLYAGSAPGLVAGALQLNVIVPAGVTPGPAVPVVLTIGNQSTTAETVTLGIQ